ncbi:hypothetical protein H4R34_005737, partial [Dimargaris verticillata]
MKYSIAILALALTAVSGVIGADDPVVQLAGQHLPSTMNRLVNGQPKVAFKLQDGAGMGVQINGETGEETATGAETDQETGTEMETEEETGEETGTEDETDEETGTEEETGEETGVPPVTDTEMTETMPTEEPPEPMLTETIMDMGIQLDSVDAAN